MASEAPWRRVARPEITDEISGPLANVSEPMLVGAFIWIDSVGPKPKSQVPCQPNGGHPMSPNPMGDVTLVAGVRTGAPSLGQDRTSDVSIVCRSSVPV